MRDIVFDESRFPLVIATAMGSPAFAEYETFLARLEALLARSRHAVVLDTSRVGLLPAMLRRRHNAWFAKHAPVLTEVCAGLAIVVTNPVVRATITATTWLQRPQYPFKVVATRSEGEAWCAEQLRISKNRGPASAR